MNKPLKVILLSQYDDIIEMIINGVEKKYRIDMARLPYLMSLYTTNQHGKFLHELHGELIQ